MATKKTESTTPSAALIEEMSRELEQGDAGTKMVPYVYPMDPSNPDAQKFVGINGRTFVIKCGVQVMVPDYVAEVLERQVEGDRAALVKAHKMAKTPMIVDNG